MLGSRTGGTRGGGGGSGFGSSLGRFNVTPLRAVIGCVLVTLVGGWVLLATRFTQPYTTVDPLSPQAEAEALRVKAMLSARDPVLQPAQQMGVGVGAPGAGAGGIAGTHVPPLHVPQTPLPPLPAQVPAPPLPLVHVPAGLQLPQRPGAIPTVPAAAPSIPAPVLVAHPAIPVSAPPAAAAGGGGGGGGGAVPLDESGQPYYDLQQLDVTIVAKRAPRGATAQRGVIIYMCTSLREDVDRLKQSLGSLVAAFHAADPLKHDYPIAVFHEDFTRDIMDELQSACGDHAIVHFVKIAFRLPHHLLPRLRVPQWDVKHHIPNPQHPTGWHEHKHGLAPYHKRASGYPFGYQHMCRFYSGSAFHLPYFRDFDWYWRLDSDSTCSGRIADPFDWMSARGAEYGYLIEKGDGGDVVEGLWNAAVNYTALYAVKPSFLHTHSAPHFKDWGERDGGAAGIFSQCPMFYTNFEVVKLSAVQSEPYQRFFRYLDALGGMYLHRWGDAPIRWLALAMFMPREKVVQMSVSCNHP